MRPWSRFRNSLYSSPKFSSMSSKAMSSLSNEWTKSLSLGCSDELVHVLKQLLLGHSRLPLRHLHILVTEHLADGLHRYTSLQRNEAGERVSSRMVGIGIARFRQLADGD